MTHSNCEFCGAEFRARKGKRFCSKQCGSWAYAGCDPADIDRLRANAKTIDHGLIKENRDLVKQGLKRCSKCKSVKPFDAYAKSKSCLAGVSSECLDCKARNNKRWISSMSEQRRKAYLLARKKRERLVGSEVAALKRISVKVARYQLRVADKLRKRRHETRKQKTLAWCLSVFRSDEKAMLDLALFTMRTLNKQPWQLRGASDAERFRWRYRYDPAFNARERVRRQIQKAKNRLEIQDKMRAALVRGGEAPSIEPLIGYKASELREHLERQFTRGMNWDRFTSGDIHIDHIVPVAEFDLSDDEELSRCWALSNLRPCWARENIQKSDKRVFLI